MKIPETDYERLLSTSDQARRLLRQEELILGVTVTISEHMKTRGVSKAELATLLGKSRPFVTQMLSGGRNLTLRTVADVSDALCCRPVFILEPAQQKMEFTTVFEITHIATEWAVDPHIHEPKFKAPSVSTTEEEGVLAA